MRKINKFRSGNFISKRIMDHTKKHTHFLSSERKVFLQLNNSLTREGEQSVNELLNQESLNRNKIITQEGKRNTKRNQVKPEK